MAVAQHPPLQAPALVFQAAPALTGLCLLSATADLVVNRIIIRIWGDAVTHQQLLWADQGGVFLRNLAAVSGFVALGLALFEFIFGKRAVPLSGRIGIAVFSAAFMPLIAMVIVLPSQWTRMELVLIIAGLAHALMILLGLVGARWHATRWLTVGLVVTVLAAFLGIASLLVQLIGHIVGWGPAERWGGAVRYAGEVCYLAGACLAGFVAFPSFRTTRQRLTSVLSAFIAAAVGTAIVAWRVEQGSDFATVFYGALRLDLFIDFPVVYAVLLGLAAALGVAALVHPNRPQQQAGAGILLLLAAGYAPRSPVLLVVTTLGIALLARAGLGLALAESERD